MNLRRLLCYACCLTLAYNLHSTVASACGVPESEFHGIDPDGGIHPGNWAILVDGIQLDLDLTVTIDGEAGQIATAPSPVNRLATAVFFIDPEPQAGQQVHLTGSVCHLDTCEIDVTFLADVPDLDPPVNASAIFLNVHDYPNIPSNDGSCQYGSDLTFWVDIELADSAAQSNVWVELYPADNPQQVLGSSVPTITGAGTTGFRLSESTLQGYTPQDLCARAQAFDRAGNLGTVVDTCGLCKQRLEDGPEPEIGTPNPSQPEWHSGDLVAEGTCPDAVLDPPPGTDTDTTESDTDATAGPDSASDTDAGTGLEGDEGCGCRTDGPQGLSWLFAAIALIGLRRGARKCRS